MKGFLFGRYISGNSVIHQLDARSKIIAAFYMIGILLLANHWKSFSLLWAFTILLLYFTRIPFRTYIRGVKPFLWLILFTTCLQILFTSGSEIYIKWGPITISHFGFVKGFYIFCRFAMIVLITTAITLTTKPLELAASIQWLLSPLRKLKVPVDEFSMMLSIALRFVPLLFDEANKIMDAQRARGTNFGEGTFIERMKALIPIFIPLLISSLNRSEEIAYAMEARGYRAHQQRSSIHRMEWKVVDLFCFISLFLLTFVIYYLQLNS